MRRYVAQQPVIDCTAKNGENPEKFCEGAAIEDENNFGKSEVVDVGNRAKWLDCIRMHSELVSCLDTLRKGKVIR